MQSGCACESAVMKTAPKKKRLPVRPGDAFYYDRRGQGDNLIIIFIVCVSDDGHDVSFVWISEESPFSFQSETSCNYPTSSTKSWDPRNWGWVRL
jgi:hypothetical protein